jgi:hypothetical protein
MQILREGLVDAIVILLRSDRNGQNFAFGQFSEAFHGKDSRMELF